MMGRICRHAGPGSLGAVLVGWLLLSAPGDACAGLNFQTIDNNNDPTFNQLLGINNTGMIAGYFGSGTPATTHPNKGYTILPPYGQGNYTNENFPGSQQTQVTGLNNASTPVTVGFWADAAGNNFGFVNKAGTFTTINNPNTPTTGITTNQLLGINDNNLAAGFYVDANGNAHGYVADLTNPASAVFTPVNVTGATAVTATGINDANLISGFFTAANGNTLGFLENLNGTGLKTFGFTGSTNTMFLGVNNVGQAVGSYVDANDVIHGLLYNILTGTGRAHRRTELGQRDCPQRAQRPGPVRRLLHGRQREHPWAPGHHPRARLAGPGGPGRRVRAGLLRPRPPAADLSS